MPAAGKNYSAFVNDSVQAISYEGEGAGGAELDVVLFANTLTDKVHQRDEFNFISNAAFHAVSGGSGESVCGYKDVAADAWYAPAVIWSAAEGIVKGCDEENFVPAAEISREQLAVMLYRYAGSPYTGGNLNSFSDALAAGEYAEEALCWAVEQGIINGDENGAESGRNGDPGSDSSDNLQVYKVAAVKDKISFQRLCPREVLVQPPAAGILTAGDFLFFAFSCNTGPANRT